MDDVTGIPTPGKDDETFWATVMTQVEPAWSEPTDDDAFSMDDKVLDAVRALARRISTRAQAYRAAGQDFDPALMAAPDVQLALLRALYETKQSVDRLAESAATVAGRSGASYTQLGAAWGGIKRQSARLKWPHAVAKRTAGQSIPLRYAGAPLSSTTTRTPIPGGSRPPPRTTSRRSPRPSTPPPPRPSPGRRSFSWRTACPPGRHPREVTARPLPSRTRPGDGRVPACRNSGRRPGKASDDRRGPARVRNRRHGSRGAMSSAL